MNDVAILAGGCFWGMEDLFRKLPGVVDTRVGYTGGVKRFPKYSEVKTGATNHAEALEVVFNNLVSAWNVSIQGFFE